MKNADSNWKKVKTPIQLENFLKWLDCRRHHPVWIHPLWVSDAIGYSEKTVEIDRRVFFAFFT